MPADLAGHAACTHSRRTQHGLDYPTYYKKLYALLAVSESGHSVFDLPKAQTDEFLKLLDISLRSDKLPSRMIAAFAKRLLALYVQQGRLRTKESKLWVLAFVADLIKRHSRLYRLL